MNPNSKTILTGFVLVLCGLLLSGIFFVIDGLSTEFEPNSEKAGRPLLPVIQWLLAAFGVYCCAWIAVGGCSARKQRAACNIFQLAIVIGFGILFRVVMISSTPIQEIDLYRYIWDGAVVANGNDPYLFSPATVLQAIDDPLKAEERAGLPSLCALVRSRPALERVLETIHFGSYTSPYPPTSQLFFALSIALVDQRAVTADYLIAMKSMLVLFDVATGFLVVLLLIHVGMSPVLSMAYWWCPLLIKEIANSGHLDSIATLFTMLAIYLTIRAMWPKKSVEAETELDRELADSSPTQLDSSACLRHVWLMSLLAAVFLAVAVAAKVYPIVLFPIWALILFRHKRTLSFATIILFALATFVFSWPMIRNLDAIQQVAHSVTGEKLNIESADPNGIEAFSKYWEMNDFLFMLVVENLKPDMPPNEPDPNPWFRITSNEFRNGVVEFVKPVFSTSDNQQFNYRPQHYAFFTTRVITIAVFGLIVIWSCIQVVHQPEPRRWLEMAFLTLAWFWLLSPTQNPWYWIWAMPLLVFARSRVWFLMSGLLFAYYLRFWFDSHCGQSNAIAFLEQQFGNSGLLKWIFPNSESFQYQGTTFFDFYVTWYEFGPLLAALFLGWIVRFVLGRSKRERLTQE